MTPMELKHKNTLVKLEAGELVATGSVDYGQPRSFEVNIYRGRSIKSGNPIWVVQKIGRSTLPGETDRYNCTIARRCSDVVKALYSLRKDKSGFFLPKASVLALEQAAEKFPEMKQAWSQFENIAVFA